MTFGSHRIYTPGCEGILGNQLGRHTAHDMYQPTHHMLPEPWRWRRTRPGAGPGRPRPRPLGRPRPTSRPGGPRRPRPRARTRARLSPRTRPGAGPSRPSPRPGGRPKPRPTTKPGPRAPRLKRTSLSPGPDTNHTSSIHMYPSRLQHTSRHVCQCAHYVCVC